MKLIILAFILSLFGNITSKEIVIPSRNYIVYDYNNGEILEGYKYYDSYSVASISKIMTAIIALESDKLFNVITVDNIINQVEGSSLYLSINDRITIIDLVYGLLLRSGNDAAVLIAKNIEGTVENFVSKMNQKGQEIGMVNTTFSNPSGLDVFDNGNISSCLDMAKLMAYCMDNPLFEEIIKTKTYHSPLKGKWVNKNKLLHNYEYCIGGKTGYTKKARRTLITISEKDYQKLIVVTFDCSNDFSFHKNIYEKYFNQFNYIVFLFEGINYIDQYYISSKKVIGIRVNKSITSGTKIYYLNPISNTLNIKFISDDYIYIEERTFKIQYFLL